MSAQDDRKDELLKTPPAGARTTPMGSSDPSATVDFPKGMDFGEARLPEVSARYELEAELGRGGMGIVYRARDKETGERVALKVLKPEIASEQALLDRFKNELKLARKITHKRVCRTYELLRFGDTVVIAMEYVEGESLRAVLDRFGGLPLRKGIELTQQICSALGEAHAQGIVHRDLKPENLMLDRAGNVKVMDFGIARSVEAGSTTTGGVIGTPAYMAPEQAEGKPVDARTDIYALGLVLYEMFAGRVVFTGDTPVSVAYQHVHEKPRPPREVEPLVPVFLEKVILKALEKDPKRRFQSVEELEQALAEPEIETESAAAMETDPEPPAHLASWQRADTYLLAGGVLAAVLFGALFDRVYPYRAMAVSTDRATVIERASKVLAKYHPEVQVDTYYAQYPGTQIASSFGENVMTFGPEEALGKAGRRALGWDLSAIRRPGQRQAHIEFDARGRLLELWFTQAMEGMSDTPATVAETRPQATLLAEELFGAKVGDQPPLDLLYNPTSRLWQDRRPADQRWRIFHGNGTPVVWCFPGEIASTQHCLLVRLNAQRLGSASQSLEVTSPSNKDWLAVNEARYFNWLTAELGMVLPSVLLVLLCVVLFPALGLYRRTVWPTLALSALASAAGTTFWYTHSVEMRSHAGVDALLTLIIFVALLVVGYAVISAPLHYLRRALPVRVGSLWELTRRGIFACAAGLSLLRGAFLGAGYLALHALLMLTGEKLRLWAPGLPFIDHNTIPVIVPEDWEGPAAPVAAIAMLASLAAALLRTGLPLALLTRARARPAFVIGGTVFVWTVSTSLLAGASAYPLWAVYAFAALQGLVFSWMLLKYDLLTCLAAALTIETWLLAYPMYLVVGQTEPWWYAWGMIQWYVVLAFALVAATLPQIVAGWRRLTAVFAG